MATRENGAYVSIGRTKAECGYSDACPVAVIDLSPESVEALVEKVAQATMAWERNRYGRIGNSNTKTYRMQARAALAAILPLPRTRKRRE